MSAKKWLNDNEWPNKPIDSDAVVTLYSLRCTYGRVCQALYERKT